MTKNKFNRRDFLLLSAAAGSATLAFTNAKAAKIPTKANIVILGSGAAGTSMANRLSDSLDGANITIIDKSKRHIYQPGLTLVGSGIKPADYTISDTKKWLPKDCNLIEENAAEIDPEANTITTDSGKKIKYDYLVVATGLILDWASVEGFSLDMVGNNGIGAVYAGPEYAAKTWAEMDKFTDNGGKALFSRPATEMKCAGAPLKYTFLTDDIARQKGTRGKIDITYAAHSKSLFGVPIVHEKVRMLFHDRGVNVKHSHVLQSIDANRKVASFDSPTGRQDIDFDFINVIPSMRAPDVVLNSPLPWADKWQGQGWAEVSKSTLRHARYSNVFAVGDIAGVPKGKTAASVKWQVPVAADHLVAQISGKASGASYNGYTSCPLITKVGRAMLIEFDYNNNLITSFPGVIAPLEELWSTWLIKTIALKATYNAMLRGNS